MNKISQARKDFRHALSLTRVQYFGLGILAASLIVLFINFTVQSLLLLLAAFLCFFISLGTSRAFKKAIEASIDSPPDLGLELVREFHETYGHPVRNTPQFHSKDLELRYNLIKEEVDELREAIDQGDLLAVYDALLDIKWVTDGGFLITGLPLREGIQEVARSNRTKLGEDGKPIYRAEDNKILKGPNFSPPDLERVMKDATQNNTTSG